jgi:hypothetical protein
VSVAPFAYVNKLFTSWRGRRLHDIPLPGDEGEVLESHIRRALWREDHYTAKELEVYMCVRFQLFYGMAHCMSSPCGWCGNVWYSRR